MSSTPHDAPPPGFTDEAPPGYPATVYPWDRPWIDIRRAFPGFGMAVLLCFLFLFCTQLPAAIAGGLLMAFFLLGNPAKFQGETDVAVILGSAEGSIAMAGAILLAQIYVIGFSLVALRWVFGREWMRLVALRWPGWSVCLIALASTPAFVFLGNLVYEGLKYLLAYKSAGASDGVEIMSKLFHSWPAAFGVLVIGFGPGIGEELWCRAFLGRGLVGRYGLWTGVILTSFLFGAIHIEPAQGTMAMLMGLWLHYVYLTTRSLWMPILLHTVNNSFAVLMTKFGPSEKVAAAPDQLPSIGLVELILPTLLAVALFGVVAWALNRTRGRLVTRGGAEPDWRPPFLSVECPPAESSVFVQQGRLGLRGGLLVFLVCALSLASLVRFVSQG